MSGRISIGFVDFTKLSFAFDRVCCALLMSFLVRNWCGDVKRLNDHPKSFWISRGIAALRRRRKGDLVAVTSSNPAIGPELEAWCRFTRNGLINIAVEDGRTRWLLRYGEAPEIVGDNRPVGSRLWLYANFDCNPNCDYCCVRSSPKAPRRALGI
jgi:hypothetical protein